MGVKVREKPEGSGRWWIFIDHQGKRKAKYVGSQKAANAAADIIQARLTLGDFGIKKETDPPAVPTFKEYRTRWLRDYVKAHCKYSTGKSYETIFDLHLKSFDEKPIDEISRQDVSALIAKKLGDEKKSKGTVRNILAPLREMFNHAIDEGILASNPATRIGRFAKHTSGKANRLKMDPFDRGEVSKLLTTAQDGFDFNVYVLLLCAVRTGMRMGELFGLQWGDLDFSGHFLQVQRSIVLGRMETPKSGQLRRVDMSQQLAEALDNLKRYRKALLFSIRSEVEHLRAAGETEESDIPAAVARKLGKTPLLVRFALRTAGQDLPPWVFMNDDGEPLDHHNFRKRVFEKVLEKAGLRRVRFHDLRHTFASLLLQQGESPQYVREQMGHHSIQITVDTYGHLIPGANRQAVNRLDDEQSIAENSEKPQPAASPAQPNRTPHLAAVASL